MTHAFHTGNGKWEKGRSVTKEGEMKEEMRQGQRGEDKGGKKCLVMSQIIVCY